MTRNLRHDLKRVAAGVCALMLVSGTVPVKPIAEVINEHLAIVASAADSTTVEVSTLDELTIALSDPAVSTIVLANDISLEGYNKLIISRDVTIDLNKGKTLTAGCLQFGNSCRVTIKNGILHTTAYAAGIFDGSEGRSIDVTLKNVNFSYFASGFSLNSSSAVSLNNVYVESELDRGITDSGNKATVTYITELRDYSIEDFGSIISSPTASDFTFAPPSDPTFDGNAKQANVSTENENIGEFTVKYYSDEARTQPVDAPANAGTYYVAIDVAEGNVYDSATKLFGDGWQFTIAKADATVTAANNITYDGTEKELVTATAGAGVKYGVPGETVSNATGSALSLNADDIKVGAIYSPTDRNGIVFPSNYTVKYINKTCTNAKVYKASSGICALKNGTTAYDLPSTANAVMVTDVAGTEITVVAVNTNNPAKCIIWSPTAPKGTNAGTYTVYYKTDGNGNYNAATGSVNVEIAKGDLTLTPAENLVFTGEAQNLVDGDVPEGTKFSFEAPIVFDVAAEDKKIGGLLETLDDCGISASESQEYAEGDFYSAAYSALGCYRYAISVFANTGNAPIGAIEDTNNYISYMDDIDINHVIVPADEAKEALEYINTYVRGLTAEKIEERCKPVEPDWLDTDTAEATNAGTYTVYYKGDGVNYSDDIKSFDVTIGKADFTLQPADDLVFTGEAQKLVDESSVADGAVVNYALKQEPEIVTNNGETLFIDSVKKGTVYKTETMPEIYFPNGYAMILGDTTYTVSESYNRVNFFYSESDGYRIAYYDYGVGCPINTALDLGENNNGVIVTDVDTENKTFTVEPVNTNDLSNVESSIELNWSETIPEATDAGTYTVYYKGDGVNYDDTVKNFTVTIAKADPTVTAPTAKIDLIYTGEDQALIEGGSTTGGTMQYSLDGVEFSTEIPEATNAGGYTVYYKVIGDDNYNSTDVKFVDVTIARADLPVTVTGYEGTFDGDPHGISVDVGDSDAVVYYAKSVINADNYADIGSTESPSFTNAGNYRVYYYVTTGNYDPNPVSGSILVTIKKADAPALTDDQKPTPVDKLVYTGEALDLVTAPENTPDGYSIRYSINGGAWISTLPTAIESGTYTVAYKYVDNTNYKDIAGETFTITVKDKYTEPMWVWADDYSSATATFIKNNNSSEPIILDAEVTSEVVAEPTYTEYGKTVYIATVKLEGKTYTYRKPVITAKLSLTHVEAVPATCDEAGNIEYWFDPEAEKYFADAKGENEIAKNDTIVAPIDHAYGEPQWIWNAENAATATFKCDNCGDEQVVNAVVTAEVTAPTYTKNGKTVYTATVNFDGKTYTDTLTVTIGKKAYTAPTISYLKGDGAVKLSWNAIEGAERYAIAGFIDGKWKLLNRTEDTSFIIDNLNPGEQYKVAVVAMFDGEYIMDFSNAITVTPKPAQEVVYPKITEIEYNEQYHQFKLNWTEVPNAQNYGIAVYLAGKWKIQTQSIPATTTSFTSPKLKAGQTYKMIVCAKVNGKWDLSALNSRAFTVTVK